MQVKRSGMYIASRRARQYSSAYVFSVCNAKYTRVRPYFSDRFSSPSYAVGGTWVAPTYYTHLPGARHRRRDLQRWYVSRGARMPVSNPSLGSMTLSNAAGPQFTFVDRKIVESAWTEDSRVCVDQKVMSLRGGMGLRSVERRQSRRCSYRELCGAVRAKLIANNRFWYCLTFS